MAWVVLFASGLMESVWALALDKSDGFSNPIPTVVFFIACILIMLGLGYAVKTLPIGVSYAVWTGVGVVATATYSMVTGGEPASLVKVLLIIGLVGCIAGLRIVSDAG